MKTVKNLIFVSVLGTMMIFASCKKETNDVVVTPPVKNAFDTIYYGTWLGIASNDPAVKVNTNDGYKFTKDSAYLVGAPWPYNKGVIWSVDTTTTPNIIYINEWEYSVIEKPTNNIMKLGDNAGYITTFQRQ